MKQSKRIFPHGSLESLACSDGAFWDLVAGVALAVS